MDNGTGEHQSNKVYDSSCMSPTLTSGYYKELFKVMEIKAVNPMDDGNCRTIKNQYHKNGVANFENQGTWGTSGVCEVIKIE